MSYYVIIRGPAGVGKTTIAKKLAGRINGHYISFDEILRSRGLDRVTPGMDGISDENFIQANTIAIAGSRGLTDLGIPVVFDGCFYRKAQYEHLIKSLPGKYFVFSLTAPVDLCVARDKSRSEPIGEMSVRAVLGMVAAYELGVRVNTAGKTEDQVIGEILKMLRS